MTNIRAFMKIAAAAALALGVQTSVASATDTLATVLARGELLCGVSGMTAGFSLPDAKGVMQGLEADNCRAVAAAVFGDASKAKIIAVKDRFPALQSGEVDVLFANATWTLGRDTSLGLSFPAPTFYDGQGILAHADLKATKPADLEGASACVSPGSSAQQNIQAFLGRNKVNFTPVVIADQGELEKAFIGGQCDIMVNDVAALASFVTAQGADGSKYALLPFRISADVLSGVVRKDDPRWFDIVRWTQYALITAEALGISKENIDTFATSDDPAVRRFLGLEGDFGKAMGIDNAWATNIVKSVGNLAEVYDRNVAPLGIPRGDNALWRDGGLQFAPAMR